MKKAKRAPHANTHHIHMGHEPVQRIILELSVEPALLDQQTVSWAVDVLLGTPGHLLSSVDREVQRLRSGHWGIASDPGHHAA